MKGSLGSVLLEYIAIDLRGYDVSTGLALVVVDVRDEACTAGKLDSAANTFDLLFRSMRLRKVRLEFKMIVEVYLQS